MLQVTGARNKKATLMIYGGLALRKIQYTRKRTLYQIQRVEMTMRKSRVS